MIDPSIFHPWHGECKTPFGAAAAGTDVKLSLYPPRSLGCSRVILTLCWEALDDRMETLLVPWVGMDRGIDHYQFTLPIPQDYQGLLWYSLTLDLGPERPPQVSEEYQLTVYDATDPVPGWFGLGMSYQVFPDRFCRLEVPEPAGPGHRIIHESWEDEPIYRPEHNGQVTNRDFFGGSLKGVESKLDYLAGLGVETIYFNPIFEASENHRYGTADYEKIDPILGDEEAFISLCNAAHKRGIRVILDGVFNHVGAVSKYFNADGTYGPGGAARDFNSPYHNWFQWRHWPDDYESWWGFKTLPNMNENDPDYRAYLFGENGILRRWLRLGADGWRLDVVDEVPDDFVSQLHAAVRAEKPDGLIIGEVWEDGSLKVAYDVRRKHILGRHCDGLMNYPLRAALIDYLCGGSAWDFYISMETIRDHYPPFAFHNAMNILGTHDTPRILTLLGVGSDHKGDWSKDERAEYRMTQEELRRGKERLKMGLVLLFAFPGSPTVYYGDEAGLTGFEDPFNRKTYPWGREDRELLSLVSRLGALRKSRQALRRGDITYLAAQDGLLAFSRTWEEDTVIAAANRGDNTAPLHLPFPAVDLLTGERYPQEVLVPPGKALLLGPA